MSAHNQMVLAIEVSSACAVVLLAGLGTAVFQRRPVGPVGRHSRAKDPEVVPLVTQLDATVFVIAIATALFLVQPSSFFYHYAAFFAPFLALVLGLGVGRLSPFVSPLLAIGALVVGTAHAVNFVDTKTAGLEAGSSLFEHTIPSGACVLSDDPAYLLLANRFTASGSCSVQGRRHPRGLGSARRRADSPVLVPGASTRPVPAPSVWADTTFDSME
jgi:hypothetical protein